jgi:MFS family permease
MRFLMGAGVRKRGGRDRAGRRRFGVFRVPRFSLGLGRDATLLFWGLFVFQLGFGLYGYLFTLYLESLGATAFQIGILIGAQGLLRIAVNLPAGIMCDRFSRRKIIVLTTLVTVPAALSFGLAQNWWQVLPGMLVIVLGNLGTPSFSSYLADAGTETDRGRAFAMVYTFGPSVALIVSPVTGGWLADATAMRFVFFASSAFYLASTLILMLISNRPLAHHGGVAATYREAFAVPVVRAIGFLQFGVLAVLAIGTTLLTNYLKEAHGVGVGMVGWLGSIAAVGSMLLSLTVGRVAWMTPIRAIAVAPLFVGLLCGVTLLTGNPIILAVAFLGRGGFMVAWSLFAAVLSETTPARLQSRAFAISEFLGAIGFALAPVAAGALYGWNRGLPLAITVVATPVLAAATVWIDRRFVRPAVRAQRMRLEQAPVVTGEALPGDAIAEGVA